MPVGRPSVSRKAVGMVTKKVLVILIVSLSVLVIAIGLLVALAPFVGRGEREHIEELIDRLATARPRDVKIMGDLVLYRTAGDESVFREIDAYGLKAVPYLIEGLHHEDREVRIQCAYLLEGFPTRAGIEALVSCLTEDREPVPPFFVIHRTLHDLTGQSGFLPSGMEGISEKQQIRRIWEGWWSENKDRIVDAPEGLVILQDDGTRIRLPVPQSTPATAPVGP